ncbi:MAG: DUF1015 domain-containing protein [Gammaproteobacteria bacterium]|nr:DUF1015 domain-containing protein [Gammaproteobacteria bacterium]
MSLIRPFPGLRPAATRAADVVAPPYDVLSSDEARARAAGRPQSFLHISKAEIDLPPATDPYSPAVYAKAWENFNRLLKQGVLARDPEPYYYFYRLVMGAHTQVGLVAAASVAAYEAGRIRRHEFTRPDKEGDRVRQIDALNAQTGPVFLTYRHSANIDAMAEIVTRGKPDVDVTADDGVRHTLWVARDRKLIKGLTQAFEALDKLYVADGHHRSAAAARVAAARKAANPRHTGEETYNYFLAVIFPDNQMRILDYNRVVGDLNGLAREAFLKKLDDSFSVQPENAAVKPVRAGEFGMYLKGQWYRLAIRPERIPHNDPVKRLDVSLLQDHLLAPILGLGDPRRDKRIDFIGGIRGLKELERRVDSGEMATAFALFPTSIHDMMAVADAGEVMPPKSTWFEPKLADGLVSHVLD